MRARSTALILVCFLRAPAAALGFDASFIGNDTYMTSDECKAFGMQVISRFAPGGEVIGKPLSGTLTKSGIEYLEGSCHFTRFAQLGQTKRWDADFVCVLSNKESQKVGEFRRNDDGSLDFQDRGNQQATHFVPCEIGWIIVD
jgi:hypothetical protein